ncbi:MAG: S8 family serine peptidase, partial [Actinobacteria bacterium]|nr:S8 family serine peptidase [Actinomycetota bacterium]
MRKLRGIIWVTTAALCVAPALAPASAGAAVSVGRDADRLIVGMRSGTAGSAAAAVDGVAEGRLLGGMWTLRVPKGRGASAAARLRGDSRVAWAEVDGPVALATAPNDPCYDPPSSPVCGNVDQWGLARVGAPVAWDLTRGSADVVVAVLDTGVDAGHPDLGGGKVIVGGNYSGASSAEDRHGHGTHVAGTIAAATDNGVGVAGLGWNTRVRAIKVLDDNGLGTYTTVVRGIEEAVNSGARVVNMSFAGEASRA